MTASTSDGGRFSRLMAHPGFVRFLSAMLAVSIAVQMQTVAVGWQIYAITRDPLDLGLIGLSQFLPFVLLVLPAGHIADRRNRARILSLCYALELLCALLLLAFTLSGLAVAWPVFAVMVIFGIARAFSMPAGQALLPNLSTPSSSACHIPVTAIDAFFNISSTTLLAVLISGKAFITGERPYTSPGDFSQRKPITGERLNCPVCKITGVSRLSASTAV
jgi:MFS family permease